MIINGGSRGSVEFWQRHLQDRQENDRVKLCEIAGLAAGSLAGALREIESQAQGTRCRNFLYHADFSPRDSERLNDEEWEQAFAIFEKHRGLEGQPRIVVEHEKHGRIHRHVIWSRINLETMRAIPDAHDAKICHAAAREIEKALGLQRTYGPFDKNRSKEPRPARSPKPWEMYRGRKSGLDARDITQQVTALFKGSADAKEFKEKLEQSGYRLLKGDRRDFCIIDSAGHVHSLARRIHGVNAAQLKTFMQGIDRDSLPSVTEARAGFKRAAGKQRDKQKQETRARAAAKETHGHSAKVKTGFRKHSRKLTTASPRSIITHTWCSSAPQILARSKPAHHRPASEMVRINLHIPAKTVDKTAARGRYENLSPVIHAPQRSSGHGAIIAALLSAGWTLKQIRAAFPGLFGP